MSMIEWGGQRDEWMLAPITTGAGHSGRTKAEILQARADELRAMVEAADRYLEGLKNTPFGYQCSGCDTTLATEYDFAAHFIVTDERHLNLGSCPNDRKKGGE